MDRAELQDRVFSFAVHTVHLVRALPNERAAWEIGRQLVRSGTAIAANYEETVAGISRADFIAKLSICRKEARETLFWLRLLKESEIIAPPQKLDEMLSEANELVAIFTSAVRTAQQNQKSEIRNQKSSLCL